MTEYFNFVVRVLLRTLRQPLRTAARATSRFSHKLAIVDRGLSRLSAVMVAAYRAFLSPHKGYRCAHAVIGGASCSEVALAAFSRQPFSEAIPGIEEQFGLCQRAYVALYSDLFDQAWQHLPSFDSSFDLMRSMLQGDAECCAPDNPSDRPPAP